MATVALKRSLSVEEEDDDDAVPEKKPSKEDLSLSCPYLDTIDRNVLDFDFEKLCSVSLSRVNVYVCLVCGKYFQVRTVRQGMDKHKHVYRMTILDAKNLPLT